MEKILKLSKEKRLCYIAVFAMILVTGCILVPSVDVINIDNVPDSAIAGTPLMLSGTVSPSNASNQDILWSIKDGGTTEASIFRSRYHYVVMTEPRDVGPPPDSVLYTTATGTVTVTATIYNGSSNGKKNYSKDFVIMVERSSNEIEELVAYLASHSMNTIANPIPVKTNINLIDNWHGFIYILYCSGKYITLDLSDNTEMKTINGISFSPNNIVSIVLPDSVTQIGYCAFYGWSGLTDIAIPDSVTSIDGYVFKYCSNLTNITIPYGVPYFKAGTFEYCTSLTSVNIPNSITDIGSTAFEYCTSLTIINIPDSVTKIISGAFSGCQRLNKVTFNHNGNTEISDPGAFPGDLVAKSGGTGNKNRYGTYTATRTGNGSDNNTVVWTKQYE